MIVLSLVMIQSCSGGKTGINLTTDSIHISIDNSGMISEISDLINETNYLNADTIAPLLSIRNNNEFH